MEQVDPQYVQSTAFRRWGISPKRTGREFHSPCPQCGGRDRFCIFEDGGYWCRVCGMKGWMDDDTINAPDPAKLAAWKAREAQLEIQRQVEIAARLKELRTRAEQSAYLLGRDDERRLQAQAYFKREGISDESIKFYELGFTMNHPVDVGDGCIECLPAYTIPIRDPHTWEIVNCQYRLADPPPGVGKYRQEAHLPAASFYAFPQTEGDALVVEGAKKAIVLYQLVDARLQVVGLPGNTPSERLLKDLECYKRIYLILDPGSDAQVERIGKLLHPRVRVVTMADKPDDLVVKHHLTMSDLRWYIAGARRV